MFKPGNHGKMLCYYKNHIVLRGESQSSLGCGFITLRQYECTALHILCASDREQPRETTTNTVHNIRYWYLYIVIAVHSACNLKCSKLCPSQQASSPHSQAKQQQICVLNMNFARNIYMRVRKPSHTRLVSLRLCSPVSSQSSLQYPDPKLVPGLITASKDPCLGCEKSVPYIRRICSHTNQSYWVKGRKPKRNKLVWDSSRKSKKKSKSRGTCGMHNRNSCIIYSVAALWGRFSLF